MRIAVYCAGEKGLASLTALLNSRYKSNLDYVVASGDNGLKKDFLNEIYSLTESNNITFFDRESDPKKQVDYVLLVGWRWMYSGVQKGKVIVLHDSLLPRYRGFSPTVSALINGDTKIGVTSFFANDEFDRGNIISQVEVPISYPISAANAISLLANVYGDLAIKSLEMASREGFEGTPQQEEQATYSLWRDQEDYRIDWNQDAARILRFIDATGFPYDGAKTMCGNSEIRILGASQVPDLEIENRTPGKVLFLTEGTPTVVCGRGLLEIREMHLVSNGATYELSKFRTKFH